MDKARSLRSSVTWSPGEEGDGGSPTRARAFGATEGVGRPVRPGKFIVGDVAHPPPLPGLEDASAESASFNSRGGDYCAVALLGPQPSYWCVQNLD